MTYTSVPSARQSMSSTETSGHKSGHTNFHRSHIGHKQHLILVARLDPHEACGGTCAVPARATRPPHSTRNRGWVLTSAPTVLRQQVGRWAESWLATTFSQLLEMRARDPGPFNYPIEVFSEWRGKAFYLCARFRARSRRPEDDFVVRHTRMTLTGFGRFDLAYFRHTERWFTVYRGV